MKISNQRLIFVTGKGGVGKSALSAAVAWREAQKGRKVCLVELGSQSFYEPFFETRGIGYEPIEIVRDVHISLLTPEECLREYVVHYLKVPKLYDIFFQNRVMKAFINATPALAELSILGKVTSDIRNILRTDYDVVVVDCYSTGHALALFRAPKGIASTVRTGPVREQSQSIHDVLCDPVETHYVIATLPEEMPINESIELHNQLKDEFNADISVVCSRLYDPPLTEEQRQSVAESVRDPNMTDFLKFLDFKMKTQEMQLKKLRQVAPDFLGVPILDSHLKGQDHIEAIAKHLETPWDLTKSLNQKK